MICNRDVLRILENVLAGDMSADDALIAWPSVEDELDEVLIGAWHELTHYAADADIRAKDLEYAEYQRNRLEAYAHKLSGESKEA